MGRFETNALMKMHENLSIPYIMKRFFILLTIFLTTVTSQVDAKKVWDFAGKGFSEATIADLAADNTRWSPNTTSAPTRYASIVTMSGELTANGKIILETAGIIFGSMSSGKINIDFGYVPPRVMLNGTNLSFTIQGLLAGKKITIVTMTANTSNARGISCSSNNATRIGGDATSLVENTNIFEVNADVVGEASVTFTTGSTGGVHIRSIIAEGDDVFDPDAPINIAYLFDSSYSDGTGVVGTENDAILQSGLMQKNVILFDVKELTDVNSQVFVDSLASLEKYDVVVVSEAISSSQAFGKKLVSLVNRVPMLNMKSFFYKSEVWNWGTGLNPTNINNGESGVTTVNVKNGFVDHKIFSDIDISGGLQLFTGNVLDKNLVQAYSTTEGSLIADDNVIATVTNGTDTLNAIHEHGTSNIYMLIPLSSDAISSVSENAIILIYNAAIYLASTKSDVIPATKPTITQEYFNGYTLVSITTPTAGASLYYTVDGTAPTILSPIYSGKLQITENCTIQSIAVKQGFDNSSVATAEVVVKSMATSPIITVSNTGTVKSVTLTAAEGASIYFTLNGATPAAATATLYNGSFVVDRPCVVKAMVTEAGKLNSEVVSENVTIDGYTERAKTMLWANFNDQPGLWSWANTDTTTATSGDVIAKFAYTVATEADPTLVPTLKTVTFENGFVVGSYGQRINLQTTGVAASGNYSPETDGDAGATDKAMSFLTTNASTDPTTAYIVTPQAVNGPFDVAVWLTGAKGASYTEKLEISVAGTMNATQWIVLDTISSQGDKFLRKRVAYYDASASVFVKFASVSNLGTNSNMMIFDIKLMGEGKDSEMSVKEPITDKMVVLTRIFTLSGIEVKAPVYGVNIVRKIYSDGSVETIKVIIRE